LAEFFVYKLQEINDNYDVASLGLIGDFRPSAQAASHNWYFSSSSGNDSGNDCSFQSSPCQSLSKVQDILDTLLAEDTATLWFYRGDIWLINNPNNSISTRVISWTSGYDSVLRLHKGTVTIDAYGNAGESPVFDGGLTDWSTNPLIDGRQRTDVFISLESDGSSVNHLELRNFFGSGIGIRTGSRYIIRNCNIQNVGQCGIFNVGPDGGNRATHENIIEYNEIGYAQRLHEFGYNPSWANGINIGTIEGDPQLVWGNQIRYNFLHHIYGEGIEVSAGLAPDGVTPTIVEYNLVGDTTAPAIHPQHKSEDGGKVIVRYNLIYSTSDGVAYGYDGPGLYFMDEGSGGSNASADVNYYGNIIIGRPLGMRLCSGCEDTSEYGSFSLYNNTFIDCDTMLQVKNNYVADAKVYNNAFIYYDSPGNYVTDLGGTDYSTWDINNNFFYNGSSNPPSQWGSGMKTGNPMLTRTSGWSSLAAAPDFQNLILLQNSALIDAGRDLGSGFESRYLTEGSDFDNLPNNAVFNLTEQISEGLGWDIGALIYSNNICTPNCSGKQCGDDGCSGSCGTCTAPATCQADGTCQNPSTSPSTPSTGACYLYDSTIPVPTDFAAAYNTLSTQHELLLGTVCDTPGQTVNFTVGNGSDLQFIWDKAYFYRDNAWQELSLDPGNSRTAPNWIIGQGSKSIRLRTNEMEQYNHLAAYVCTYQNDRWNCGCKDQPCLTPYWNLQSFQMNVPVASACTDTDGDYYISENIANPASNCSSICGPNHNAACQGYNDCDDGNASINWDATEICNDNIDNNCHDGIDENCSCVAQGGVCCQSGETCSAVVAKNWPASPYSDKKLANNNENSINNNPTSGIFATLWHKVSQFTTNTIARLFQTDTGQKLAETIEEVRPSAKAASYNWYFSNSSGNDTTGNGTQASPWRSLNKMETMINSITNGTDSANIYLRRGDTWTLNSFGCPLRINKSNITIDAYGSGNRPIIDGQNIYPADNGNQVPVIGVGDANGGSTAPVSGVYINNLEIRNLSNGSANPDSKAIGIAFYGSGASAYATGPGAVRDCKIMDAGWSAITLYRVPNHLGSSHAIKIERNWIERTNWYGKILGGNGPQSINTNDGWSSGHEARYNYIYQSENEGIGAGGLAIAEYNVVVDTNNPCIYVGLSNSYDTSNEADFSSIVRYNLCYNTRDLTWTEDSNRGGSISVNDERYQGENSEIHHKIYGNVVAGSQYGIQIKHICENDPTNLLCDSIGEIEVYNNLLIDNKYNFVWNWTSPTYFTDVKIKNNVSIVSTDAASHSWGGNIGSAHLNGWHDADWTAWDIGPNFFYGLGWTNNDDIEKYGGGSANAWKHADNAFGTAYPLPKTSGWIDLLVGVREPTFADMYPASGSEIVDRWETVVLSSEFQNFLTTGTDWSTAGTANPVFNLANQNTSGLDWDFGAIIRGIGTTPPTCTPDCSGKNCGPDGCGGTCGACTGSASCQNGVCIDEVPYTQATSDCQVCCFNGVCAAPPPDSVHYQFDEGAGTIAHDAIGNYDGTVSGASWTSGQIGQALSFDGVNDNVSIGDVQLLTNDLTISTWVRTANFFQVNGYSVSKYNTATNEREYAVYFNGPANEVHFLIGSSDGSSYSFGVLSSAASILTNNTWNHIVFTRSGSAAHCYINGVEQALAGTINSNNFADTTARLMIGNRTDGGRAFLGQIDDVRIYNRVLTAQEVSDLYNEAPTTTVPPPTTSTYNWYFSNSTGNDVTGNGTQASPWRSLAKLNAMLDTLTNGTDSASIYLRRGDMWTLTSNIGIQIDRSNVTIDAYGSGPKPILSGGNYYPHIRNGFVITVANNSSLASDYYVRNVSINNLRIINTHNGSEEEGGGGIQFAGIPAVNGHYYGGGGIFNCEFHKIGWSAISIFRVPNNDGPSNAIKIENNDISLVCEYPRWSSFQASWPQAIQTMDNYTYGHECRYNRLQDAYCEGIGATGFDIVEYNVVSNTKAPSIYMGGPNGNNNAPFSSVIRYNLVWGDLNGAYGRGEIRVDDEGQAGDNSGIEIEIYGNIVVAGVAGITIRNAPVDGNISWSSYGSLKVYNNLLIDNNTNIQAAQSNRFNNVEIKNNVFIINPDAVSASQHLAHWTRPGESEDWSGWTWGPNFWHGDTLPGTPFYSASRDATGNPLLPKTSGWRNLTAIPSLNDFRPQSGSDMIDNPNTDDTIGSVYRNLINSGEFANLPANPAFTLADQNTSGSDWDFGAVISASASATTQPCTLGSPLPCGL
jgi:hypothetical protein